MSAAHSFSLDTACDPIVTIAIPTFNRGSWLEGCVFAALSQTYQRFEVLISDNASTDETVEVLTQFRDLRLRVIRQKSNIGLLANWNACLAQAKGKYIVFVSDDDRIAPRMLERCMALVERDPGVPLILTLTDVYSLEDGRTRPATPNGKFSTGICDGTDLLLECLRFNLSVQMCSIMIRTDALRAIGGFPINLPKYGADMAAWATLLLKGRAGFVNESCATYCVHSASETSNLTMNERLSDERKLAVAISSTAQHFITDLRKCRQVTIESKRYFVRHLISTLRAYRRRGGKLREVRRLIWHWRHDLRHIGILDAFTLPRTMASILFPKMVAWIRQVN